MDLLIGVLGVLVAIALLFEVAGRLGLPYPSLFVVAGIGIGLVPGVPRVELEPELILIVFLPALLFEAAVQVSIRELRSVVLPVVRLSLGLVLFTMVVVAIVGHLALGLEWGPAFVLGAIVGPTDAVAAAIVFRRLGVPRVIQTLIEGESLFNDATALVAYRAALLATISGTFVLVDAVARFGIAAVGGVGIGLAVGAAAAFVLRRLDNAPVEVLLSLVIPFAAYLPAERLELSGVLATVTAGLIIGSRFARILTPGSRVLWQSTWEMVGFVLNGVVFVLIGLELPRIVEGLGDRPMLHVLGVVTLICAVVVVTRMAWTYASSLLPNSPRRQIAEVDPELARRLVFVVGWSGFRGAVSLAAALALPADFAERDLILLTTFAVIVVTLVGQGLTLPRVVRWAEWDGVAIDGDELGRARGVAYDAGLAEVARLRATSAGHAELLDRIEASLRDRTEHLGTEDPTETEERRQERREHQDIQRSVIGAQRAAIIDLRDRRQIGDATLREVERDLDLEELRMEG